MASSDYYEQIEETFEAVEVALESLPDDVDIRGAEGVINATFSNGVVFVFSRQPPQNSSGWRPLVEAFTTPGMTTRAPGGTPKVVNPFIPF